MVFDNEMVFVFYYSCGFYSLVMWYCEFLIFMCKLLMSDGEQCIVWYQSYYQCGFVDVCLFDKVGFFDVFVWLVNDFEVQVWSDVVEGWVIVFYGFMLEIE